MLMIMEIVSKEFDLEQLGKKCTPLKLCLCDTVIFWYWGHKTWALQTMRAPRVSGSTGSRVGLRGSRGSEASKAALFLFMSWCVWLMCINKLKPFSITVYTSFRQAFNQVITSGYFMSILVSSVNFAAHKHGEMPVITVQCVFWNESYLELNFNGKISKIVFLPYLIIFYPLLKFFVKNTQCISQIYI